MKLDHPYLYYRGDVFPPLPFDIKLNLNKVFAFWEDKAANGSPADKIYAKNILEGVAHVPQLREPTDDLEFIEKQSREIQSLLSILFPEILTNNEIKAASLPFYPVFFNLSNRMKSILDKAGPDFRIKVKNVDDDEMYISACSFIINVYYKVQTNYKRALFLDIPDLETGIIHSYRAFINGDFNTVKPKPGFTPLSPEDIQFLVDNSRDVQLWKKMIPPGSFEFEGITLFTLFDQTEDEALSELKQLLLESDALRNDKTIEKMQGYLAQYLGIDKVDIRIEAYDKESGEIETLHGSTRPSKLLGDEGECSVDECFCDMSFEALIERKESFAISNVKELKKGPSPFIKRMDERNVGSFIVAPLKMNDEIIAFIELTSPHQGVLNSMMASKMKNVLPMFAVAVARSIDTHQMQLEAIIQDKFTALHPSVTWKFLKAAQSVFQHRVAGRSEDFEELSFQDVHPFYGQFDIRGSSDARNESIREDLKEQLELACDVLQSAMKHQKLPIYQQLHFRLDQFKSELDHALHAGDEVRIFDFIQRELDPVFNYLETVNRMAPIVLKYRNTLDPKLGVIYRRRKEYEKSVTIINDRISEYLDQQQVLAQEMFPHYFEKYKTDGVEYNIYMGQSIVQSGIFHPLHLKNLRLWQLLVMCGVENLHQSYKDELPLPLDITTLILVHSNPMAIRFRMDEKRFDVDGTYNIRYEILKKRIDKAHIKGSDERITQPGKLSIVYSQDWEAEEYLQYIQYLQAASYLDNTIERLELEDLQGASGLRAFRVAFRYEVSPETLIREMMQEMNA